MIWLKKIIKMLLVIALAGCTQIGTIQGEHHASKEIDSAVISKPDMNLVINPEMNISEESESESAHRYNAATLEPVVSSVENITGTTSQVCSPLASVPLDVLPSVVSDPYNPPLMGKDDRHQGADFAYYRRFDRASIAGEVVQSVFDGRVASIVEDKFPYGNAVMVETPYALLSTEIQQTIGIHEGQSLYTLYGHLASNGVQKISNEIDACQAIGIVGKTGNTDVEHLHLEMRIGLSNQVILSMGNYKPDITLEEREAYLLWRTSGVFVHFDPMKILDITQ